MRNWFIQLVPVLRDMAPGNDCFSQSASDILSHIIERLGTNTTKELKKDTLDLFNSTDFFKCSAFTLRNWVKIIDRVATMDKTKENIFDEYLSK